MKKLFTVSLVILTAFSSFAQIPQKMSYQCVVRNTNGALVINQSVGIRISILQGTISGTVVYQETYNPNPQTNANGLLSLEIGGGLAISGTFSEIDWSAGPYFLKTETDPTGGTNYTITGTSQLLSVPFALYAKTAQTADYNNLTNLPNLSGYLTSESDPIFVASPAHGITNGNITNWNTAYGWGNHASAGYVSNTTTLSINGTTLDLTANRSWSVGTVTSVGLSLPSIFSLSGSPVTTTGTLTASLASQSANLIFASPNASAGTPAFRALLSADIPNLDWSKITSGKPTTTIGYGITDAVLITGNQTISGIKTFNNDLLINGNVGIGTTTPGSKLEVAGQIKITGGTPAMGKVLTSDATGLATWQAPSGSGHYIGESYGGGIVFYVYDNGQHGLIAATADQSTGIRWYAGSYTYTMANADGVGAGKANTAIIIANQGYGDGATYAARICNEYQVTVGGVTYGDWYLPSKFELNLLYLQKVGGFAHDDYWSSTEGDNSGAWGVDFYKGMGAQYEDGKNYPGCVRAIRGF